jgi:molybdenum cofactor biosynthesis protein B
MGAKEHHAGARRPAACAVITASDTRTPETDTSGQRIRALLEQGGHRVVAYVILPDDPEEIGRRLDELLADPAVDAVVVNGGTGLAPRDTTYEAIVARLEKRIDGFGELFRSLSFQEIGPAAMLSRAVAGVARGRVVASLPGSTAAVELAMSRLLVPELGHMVGLVRGGG